MQTDSLYILELIGKITQALKMIRRVSSFMSRQNLLLIYHSLVEQRLNYCSEVWDTLSDGLSQKLQNRAARIITKSAYDASSSELLVELRWRALAHERRTKKAIKSFTSKTKEQSSQKEFFIQRSCNLEFSSKTCSLG